MRRGPREEFRFALAVHVNSVQMSEAGKPGASHFSIHRRGPEGGIGGAPLPVRGEGRIGILGARLGDHRLELVELGGLELARLEGVDEILVDGAVEDAVEKPGGEIAKRAAALDERCVDVGLAVATVRDEALLFHDLKQAEDGRIGEPRAALVERVDKIANGRFSAFPENLSLIHI